VYTDAGVLGGSNLIGKQWSAVRTLHERSRGHVADIRSSREGGDEDLVEFDDAVGGT